MSTTVAANPPSFGALSDLLDEQPHAFALSGGSDALRQASEQALKDVFQIALDSEPTSLPPLESFLRELVAQNPSSSADDPLPSLPPTPLDALYTADLGPEQVWEQLELRATKLVDVLGQFGILADLDEADDDAGGGLSREEKIARGIALDSDEEDEDDEELSDGAFDGIDDMSDSEASGSDDDDNDDDDDESPLSDPDAFDDSAFPSADEEEDDFAGLDYGDEQASGADDVSDEEEDEEDDTHRRITDLDAPGSKRDARRSHPTLDDAFFSIDAFNRETEELEALDVTSGALGADESASEADDDDDAAGLEMPAADGMDDDDDEGDDDDEDDFEKLMSAGPPAPGGDIWAQAVDAGDGLGTDEVKYADFFAPPSKPPSGAAKRAQAKALKTAGGAKGKGKAAARRRDEDEMDLDEDEMMEVSDEEDEEHGDEQEDDEEEEDDDEDDEEEGDEEMDDEEEEEAFGARKGKTDLFADDDEAEETDSAPQSTHAKRLAALNAQIASLEAENAGPKQWALAGEASSRARPLNAVLEEDLEFDTVGKQVPLVTEEKVKNLEEKIKQRILENNYNDVERRRPLDAKPFLPSRVFELSDEKSTRSLAQIYEDEYTASAARQKGGKAPLGEKDAKLAKEHEEIEQAWDEICYKLDALSNANFTPKQPKAHIQSISNTASISLESALPPTLRASTLLAPEEVFNPPSAADLVASSELTPGEKRARHGKDKKRRRKHRDQLEAMEGMSGQSGRKRVGTRQAKDEALKTLVKEGKGVTVIGKDAKKFDRQGRRQNANPGGSDRPADGTALKL